MAADKSARAARSLYAPIGEKAIIPFSFVTPVVAVLLVIGTYFLANGFLYAVGFATGALTSFDLDAYKEFTKSLRDGAFGPFMLLALPFGAMSLVVFFWVTVIERRSLGTIGFTARNWLSRYLRGFVFGLLLVVLVIAIIYQLGGYRVVAMWPAATGDAAGAALTLIFLFLLGFLIQGAAEEIVFRGWWMSALAARRGVVVALVVPALFFGLAHMGNVWPPTTESMVGVANIVLYALMIGLYAVREGSLWGVCGWHSAWNWLVGLGFGLEVSGAELAATPLIVDLDDSGVGNLITGGAFGPEASLVTTAVLGAGCVWFLARLAMNGRGGPDGG